MTTIPATPTAPTVSPARRPWSAVRTVLVVAGSVLALSGLGSLAGGAVTVAASQQRDGDGFFTSGQERFATDTYAISATSLHVDVMGPDFYGDGQLGEVRIQVRPADPGASMFVGVGPAKEVNAYLDAVNHVEISDLDAGPFDVRYSPHAGGQPATGPAAQTFWTATGAGAGPQTLSWPITSGDWAVVIMNTDASAGIQADVSTGARLPFLGTVAVIAFVTGGVLLIAGLALILVPVLTRGPRGRRQPATAPPGSR
jgi:hypothetical protein